MINKLLFTLFLLSVLFTRSYSQCATAVFNDGGPEYISCGNLLGFYVNEPPAGYKSEWSVFSPGIEILSSDQGSVVVKNDSGGLLVYTLSDSSKGCISSDTVLIRKSEQFMIVGNSYACQNALDFYYAPISTEATYDNPKYTWKINGQEKSDSLVLYAHVNPNDQITLELEIPGCGTFYDTSNIQSTFMRSPSVILGDSNTLRDFNSASVCPGGSLTIDRMVYLGDLYSLNWYLDSLLISTDTLLTIGNNIKPGTYTLKVTGKSSDKCFFSDEVSDEITLTVEALDLKINSDYGNTICPGVSTYLTTNGFENGAYSWYRNNQLISNEEVIQTMSEGVYKVNFVSAGGCQYASDTLSLKTIKYPQQKLTLSPGSYVCEGSKTRLTAETEFYHEWTFEGKNLGPSYISAEKPGWYTVTYFDENCSFSDSVYLESRPAYVDGITLSAVWVEDYNLEVRASNIEKTGKSSWGFDGGGVQEDSLLTIYSYFPGPNTITFYTETSCGLLVRKLDVTIADSVSVYSLGGPSVITSAESYTFTAACIPGAKYKWYVPAGFKINYGADSCVINISSVSTSGLRFQPGENEICVERTDKEPAVMCKSLEIITSAVEKNAAAFNVFPNPFEDNFTVSDKSVNKNYRIRILDVAGKILSDANLVAEANYGDDLKQGVYFIQIYNGDSSYSYKLMKN